MNKLLRLYLIIAAIAMFAAFISQVFIPESGASGTAWGLSPGWQREIGFWNITMLVIIIGTLIKGDSNTARVVATALVVMGILLGSNHLFSVISNGVKLWNVYGAVVNYIGVIVGSVALLIKSGTSRI